MKNFRNCPSNFFFAVRRKPGNGCLEREWMGKKGKNNDRNVREVV